MEVTMEIRRAVRLSVVATLLGALVVACGTTTSPTPPATPSTEPAVEPSSIIASDVPAAVDAPPSAALAAEGGDPVIGQLGSYTWGDSGSDAPWLPGSPTHVASGEPLTVTLQPDVPIAAWRARYVPAGAGDPAGAVGLGEGSGRPVFGAPAGGPWTVEVAIEFAGGEGTASYFWRLEVD
jgi:hypothetical protein